MRRVVITGLGCISPLGNNVDTMWSELLKGSCAIDTIKSLNTDNLTVKVPSVLPFASRPPCCLTRVIKCDGSLPFVNTTASPKSAPTFVPPM